MDGINNGPFFDREANGGAGAEVPGHVVHAVQFRLTRSTQCIARGVMQMDTGAIYTWTVRRPGQGDTISAPGREICRIATRMPYGKFADHARGLLDMERSWIDPDLIDGPDGYQAQVNAL